MSDVTASGMMVLSTIRHGWDGTNALAGIVPTKAGSRAIVDAGETTNSVTGAEDDKGFFEPSLVLGPGTEVTDFIWGLPELIAFRKITVQARLRGLGGIGDTSAPGDLARARVSIVVNGTEYLAADYATWPDQDIFDPAWYPSHPGDSDATWDLGAEVQTDQIILRDTWVHTGGIEYWHAFDCFEIAVGDLGIPHIAPRMRGSGSVPGAQ